MKVRAVKGADPDLPYTYPTRIGETYRVIGISAGRQGAWLHIPYPHDRDLIALVDSSVAEVVDGRIPHDWVVSSSDGEYLIGPPSLHEPFFHDRLSDSEPDAVVKFRGMMRAEPPSRPSHDTDRESASDL